MRKIITVLLCIICFNSVPAQAAREPVLPESVIPGGHTLGVKLQTDGLMVVGMAPVNTYDGAVSPADEAGITGGDIITHVGERAVYNVAELLELTGALTGEALEITYIRNGTMRNTTLIPAKSADDNKYRLGVWVRDSMAGIGTITFYDPETGLFGALGHGINEAETGRLLPMGSGHVLYSEVESVRQGQPGTPGELKGAFRNDKAYGHLLRNTESGLFGTLTTDEAMGSPMQKPVDIALPSEIQTGEAFILSNVNGDKVERFDIEIVKIFSGDDCRNFMIRVTDERLLDRTGGIVQGMSGSPVLQNGKLVGAVTHVLINDPQRGYGIFAESMIREGMLALEAETWLEPDVWQDIAA